MSYTLKIRCPHCEKIGRNGVDQTDSGFYYTDGLLIAIGTTKDDKNPLYRTQKRSCENCGKSYQTIIIPSKYFFALNDLMLSQKKELDQARKDLIAKSEEIQDLKQRLTNIFCISKQALKSQGDSDNSTDCD